MRHKICEVDRVIGMNMRRLRVARGLTQSDVAKALGLTFQQVQKYERADNRLTVAMMLKIADFLHVPVTEIVTGAYMPAPQEGIEHARETLEIIRAFGGMTPRQRNAFSAFARAMGTA